MATVVCESGDVGCPAYVHEAGAGIGLKPLLALAARNSGALKLNALSTTIDVAIANIEFVLTM
jgi:hypothetical protein